MSILDEHIAPTDRNTSKREQVVTKRHASCFPAFLKRLVLKGAFKVRAYALHIVVMLLEAWAQFCNERKTRVVNKNGVHRLRGPRVLQ